MTPRKNLRRTLSKNTGRNPEDFTTVVMSLRKPGDHIERSIFKSLHCLGVVQSFWYQLTDIPNTFRLVCSVPQEKLGFTWPLKETLPSTPSSLVICTISPRHPSLQRSYISDKIFGWIIANSPKITHRWLLKIRVGSQPASLNTGS